MKIAFITPEFITESNFDGGLANYLARVSEGLKSYGHEPIIIVSSHKDEMICHNDIKVFRVNATLPYNFLLSRIPFIRRLIPILSWIWQSHILNKKLLDIHCNRHIDIVQYASCEATALFRPRSIPSVVRISSLQSHFDDAYSVPITIVQSLLQFVDKHAILKGGQILSPSFKMADEFMEITRRNVEVIESPYIIDDSRLLDDQIYNDLLLDKKYLLFYGTIGLLKGAKVIADILPDLLSTHKDIYFVFIGKDAGYQAQPMMNYIWEKAGPHRGRIIYLGTLRQDLLFPIISNSLGVILPSLLDNFPNTCIESMSMGKIVIGTKETSFEQLITDGKNGLLCKAGSPNSLLEAVNNLISFSPQRRTSLGNEAKQRIKQLHPQSTISRLLEIYNNTISLHNNSEYIA
jgi:glycogen synthase